MTWLALPWFVLRTTGSPQRMTWVIIAEVLPVAVLGFWGGAIAGRVGTRRTMLTCDLARVPLFAAIPALHAAGALPFPVLLALVAVSGVFLAPYFSVQRAVIPELVGEDQAMVAQAAALSQAANRTDDLRRPSARRRADQSHRHRRRPVRRRGDLSGVVPARRDVRPATRGRDRRRRPPACSTASVSWRATSCCGSGRLRSP